MLSKVNLAFAGALTVLSQSAVAAGNAGARSLDAAVSKAVVMTSPASLPTTNIDRVCRDAESAALPESRSSAYDSCIRDERSALEKLRHGWTHYSAAARATCAEPSGGVPFSYVELLTCLEMQPGGSFSVPSEQTDSLH